MWPHKPTRGRDLKGVTTAVSPSVLALRSEQGERHLPSRSDSTRKGTHHIVKRPDQAGIRVPPSGPSHLHPTRGNNLNPATTRSYVEVVRGVAPRSGRPTTATGPPHNTRYILLPHVAPILSRSSTHSTQHPVRRPTPTTGWSRPLLPNNGQHPPQPTPVRAMRG